jgi:hypothetical protein
MRHWFLTSHWCGSSIQKLLVYFSVFLRRDIVSPCRTLKLEDHLLPVVTEYSVFLQIPSVSGGRIFHQQPEDVPFRGDRDSHNYFNFHACNTAVISVVLWYDYRTKYASRIALLLCVLTSAGSVVLWYDYRGKYASRIALSLCVLTSAGSRPRRQLWAHMNSRSNERHCMKNITKTHLSNRAISRRSGSRACRGVH